jgi:hypothetical protein
LATALATFFGRFGRGGDFALLFLGLFRQIPIFLERVGHPVHDAVIAENYPHFTARVQLDFPQTLAADERIGAIANNGASVQPHVVQFVRLKRKAPERQPPEDPNIHTRCRALLQQTDHCRIAHGGIVDKQLLARAFDECRELPSRVRRAHHEIPEPGLIQRSFGVRLEQPRRFVHQLRVSGDDAETTAALDIQICQIEGEQVQFPPVDDHHLPVVAD